MSARITVLSAVLLAILTVAFFWKLALTNLIMVGVDIFTYFYPYRFAINQALQHGVLPLWNPYLFMGVPLLANAQAGLLYPLNWPFVWLNAPDAINVSIVLHACIGALGCFAFSRSVLRLEWHGSFLAASVFALGGYTGSLVEHVNQLQAAAWFPWLLCCANGLLGARKAPALLMGAVVVALQLLAGHAQISFISFFGMGIWILASEFARQVARRSPRESLRKRAFWIHFVRRLSWLALPFATLIILGAVLSAVQLVPMLELSRLSIRGGGMTYREAVAFSLPPSLALEAFLPTYGLGEPLFSEFVAFTGVVALALAVMGLWLRWRRHIALLALLAAGLALAFGLYDPLYYVLFKLVPGFGLFRVPARWLFLFTFGAAGFAGIGLKEATVAIQLHVSAVAWRRVTLGAFLALITTVVTFLMRLVAVPAATALLAWVIAAIAVAILIQWPMPMQMRRSALLLAALIELFTATRWLPYNQPTAPEAFSSLRPAIAFLLSEDRSQPWRILSYSGLNWDPGDLDDIRAMFGSQLSSEAIYQYTVAAKTKEIVGPNLALRYGLQSVDGYDGGILPLARFVGLQSLFLTPSQVNPDGRLRERLRAIPPARWLDLLDVRYVTADKIFDVWVDGIYYDLGLGMTLDANTHGPQIVETPTDFTATGIGVVSYLQGAGSLLNDTPVAELQATTMAGKTYTFTLRAGRDTAESDYTAIRPAHAKARAVHTLRDDPAANEYYSLLRFDGPERVTSLTVRSLLTTGNLVLHGMSLVDAASGTGQPITFSADGRYRLVHSGDVKIYQVMDTSGRAIVVHHTDVIPDDAQALRTMAGEDFDPRREIVLSSGQALAQPASATGALVSSYEDQRVVVQTNDNADGYLLLKDSWYPGWHAVVDGQAATVERADTYFRAVYVPGGRHTVEFSYEPDSLKLGAVISAAALILLLSFAIAAWKRAQQLTSSSRESKESVDMSRRL